MKHTLDDKFLTDQLKSQVPKPSQNVWFTRRVINHLPPRASHTGVVKSCVAIVCAILLVAGWVLFFRDNSLSSITLQSSALLAVMTLATTAAISWPLLQSDD